MPHPLRNTRSHCGAGPGRAVGHSDGFVSAPQRAQAVGAAGEQAFGSARVRHEYAQSTPCGTPSVPHEYPLYYLREPLVVPVEYSEGAPGDLFRIRRIFFWIDSSETVAVHIADHSRRYLSGQSHLQPPVPTL